MLELNIPSQELFNEEMQEFINTKPVRLKLEHSLVSLKKWEAKYHKAFLSKDEKTSEEVLDYIRMMTITQNVDESIYKLMSQEIIDKILEYIEDPMSATTINEKGSSRSNNIITAEIIYYWMIRFNVPFECQKWHLNSLLTLIRVCNIKEGKPKKMSRNEILNRNRALNAERKALLNTKG